MRQLLKIAVSLAPWVTAMYLFYWLDASGTWSNDTAHRGKLSVMILGAGMVSSFFIWSHFAKRD